MRTPKTTTDSTPDASSRWSDTKKSENTELTSIATVNVSYWLNLCFEWKSDVDWLSKLSDLTLSGGDLEAMGFDDYLQREWHLFLQNKKEITVLK